jgi:hypothetical protein
MGARHAAVKGVGRAAHRSGAWGMSLLGLRTSCPLEESVQNSLRTAALCCACGEEVDSQN